MAVVCLNLVELRNVVKSHESHVMVSSIADVGVLFAWIGINDATGRHIQVHYFGNFSL